MSCFKIKMHTEGTERTWWKTPRTAKRRKPASGGTTSGSRYILRDPIWVIGCKSIRNKKQQQQVRQQGRGSRHAIPSRIQIIRHQNRKKLCTGTGFLLNLKGGRPIRPTVNIHGPNRKFCIDSNRATKPNNKHNFLLY